MVTVNLLYNIFWKILKYTVVLRTLHWSKRWHDRSLEPIFSTQTISNKRLTYRDDWFLNPSYTHRTWAILQPPSVSRAIFLPNSVSKKNPRLSITIEPRWSQQIEIRCNVATKECARSIYTLRFYRRSITLRPITKRRKNREEVGKNAQHRVVIKLRILGR